MKTVLLKLDDELHRKIKVQAAASGITIAALLSRILKQAMEK